MGDGSQNPRNDMMVNCLGSFSACYIPNLELKKLATQKYCQVQKKKKSPTKAFYPKGQKRGSIAMQNYFSMIIVLLQTNIIENTVAQNPPHQQIKKFNFKKCTWSDGELATILEFLLLLLLPKYFAQWYWNHKWLFFDRFDSTKKTSKKTSQADRWHEKGCLWTYL